MNKLFATVALIVLSVSVTTKSFAGADPEDRLGCSYPIIEDQRVVAELESKSDSLKGLRVDADGVERVEQLAHETLLRYPFTNKGAIAAKIRHILCVLERDPDSGLSSPEREELLKVRITRHGIPPTCRSTCTYAPGTQLKPIPLS